MSCIWELSEATVTDVWQEISKRKKLARNTVFDRHGSARKAWLAVQKADCEHSSYSATVQREHGAWRYGQEPRRERFSDSPIV